MDGPFSWFFEGKLHLWDLGLLVFGPILAVVAACAILDAPGKPEGERIWLRRLSLLAAVIGGLFLSLSGIAVWDGLEKYRAYGRMFSPSDNAVIWARTLVPLMLACLFGLGTVFAAAGVVAACRRGLRRPLLWIVAAILVVAVPLAFSGFSWNERRSHWPNPAMDILVAPVSMELFGSWARMLLPLPAGLVAILAVGSLLFVKKGTVAHREILERCCFRGMGGLLLAALLLQVRALSDLGQYAYGGRLDTPSLPRYLLDRILQQPVVLSTLVIGLIALVLGLPALRAPPEAEGAG